MVIRAYMRNAEAYYSAAAQKRGPEQAGKDITLEYLYCQSDRNLFRQKLQAARKAHDHDEIQKWVKQLQSMEDAVIGVRLAIRRLQERDVIHIA